MAGPRIGVQAESWTSFQEPLRGPNARTRACPLDSARSEPFHLQADQNPSAHPQLWPLLKPGEDGWPPWAGPLSGAQPCRSQRPRREAGPPATATDAMRASRESLVPAPACAHRADGSGEGCPGAGAGTPGSTSGGVSVEKAALLGVRASGVTARAWEQPRALRPLPCSLRGEPAPISQRRAWGLGRGARPGPPAHTQQRASDAGPAPRTASASGLGGEEAAPR